MVRKLRQIFTRRGLLKPKDYEKALQRYRQAHPESLEEEREQIQRWIEYVAARNRQEQQDNIRSRADEEGVRITEALFALRDVARAAFLSHPASTEYDFRRCWPSIRDEVLKQHALEELASNPALFSRLARQSAESVHELQLLKSRESN